MDFGLFLESSPNKIKKRQRSTLPPGLPQEIETFYDKLEKNMTETQIHVYYQNCKEHEGTTNFHNNNMRSSGYYCAGYFAIAFIELFFGKLVFNVSALYIQSFVWGSLFILAFAFYLYNWICIRNNVVKFIPYLPLIYKKTKAEMLEISPNFTSFGILANNKLSLTIMFQYSSLHKHYYIDDDLRPENYHPTTNTTTVITTTDPNTPIYIHSNHGNNNNSYHNSSIIKYNQKGKGINDDPLKSPLIDYSLPSAPPFSTSSTSTSNTITSSDSNISIPVATIPVATLVTEGESNRTYKDNQADKEVTIQVDGSIRSIFEMPKKN